MGGRLVQMLLALHRDVSVELGGVIEAIEEEHFDAAETEVAKMTDECPVELSRAHRRKRLLQIGAGGATAFAEKMATEPPESGADGESEAPGKGP
ncbi:hypothetical protein JCM30471_05180 [Desulfuromonas carbonis]